MLANQRSGRILARRVTLRRNLWERSLGLMFRRQIDPDEAMVFCLPGSGIREAGVHMLFVPFPLALVWLDGGCRVVDRVLARPWQVGYRPTAPSRYFVEAHSSRLDLVQEGDRLTWW
jgi:uncharacterized membrane protein (UPF0127 family)